MRLFLDADVLFTAAHNPRGKAALVIELETDGCWTLLSSELAFEEARRNLQRKYPNSIHRLTECRTRIQFVEHQPSKPFPDGLAVKDRPIFQAARAGKATHLLTGDLQHFGPLMNKPDETFGIQIQTVAQFLSSIA
jgi:predicted nucleic acid-binding protein